MGEWGWPVGCRGRGSKERGAYGLPRSQSCTVGMGRTVPNTTRSSCRPGLDMFWYLSSWVDTGSRVCRPILFGHL
jgi:hypothetical protein